MKSVNPFVCNEVRRIRKIVHGEDGWYLYADYESTPLFIDSEYYHGSAFAWYNRLRFWHKPTVEVSRVTPYNFITRAVLDGKVLFELEEAELPEYVQKTLAKGEAVRLKEDAFKKPVFEARTAYAAKSRQQINLGYQISRLHVCLRTYLRLHLNKGDHSADSTCRIHMMYRLCVMAEEILCHRIGGLDSFSIDHGSVRSPFNMRWGTEVGKYLNELKADDPDMLQYLQYIIGKLNEAFPEIEDPELLLYLCHLVQNIVYLYLEDRKTIENLRKKNLSEAFRGFSDEEYYREARGEMKLLRFVNPLLPTEITDEEIRNFI